ncbi:hypothetical protein KJ840_02895 [Patescibacteria group bacterium]|nr:hypothetical protein [Patescibacteria group bacterium]
MKSKLFLKSLFAVLIFSLLMPVQLSWAAASLAGEVLTVEDPVLDVSSEVTAADIGESESAINNASAEATESTTTTGTLIEIGNTTAENTTIIIRTEDENGATEDQTVEVGTATLVQNDSFGASSLSDWIAGDQITFTATEYTNSGAVVAGSLRNRAHHAYDIGKNGWVAAIRPEQNQMDITWDNQTYTLNTSDARMVAGLKNPAALTDFQIGDRIRARVVDDNDNSPYTFNAHIVVVLRRGDTLFMRVTRWVVSGTVYTLPEDLTKPLTMDVKILNSPFFEAGDVNNLVGAPGDIIKVDIDENTKLIRKYFGKAFLKEFSEGDDVRIIGRRDENTGHIVAKFIKNNSVQKLGKVYRLGKVDAVDTAANTIDITLVRTRMAVKNWTIEVVPSAKIYQAGEEIAISDIQPNDKLRIIGGSADWTDHTIMAQRINVLIKQTKPTAAETETPDTATQ